MELGALLLAVALSGLYERWRRRTRSRRAGLAALVACGIAGVAVLGGCGAGGSADPGRAIASAPAGSALAAVGRLQVKGRAPQTGYARSQFGEAWSDVDRNGCNTRNDVLRRDLTAIRVRSGSSGCVVIAGQLADPYTGRTIAFDKSDADAVQIDHVVALADAWQTGAQGWTLSVRLSFANDPLNLLAVDGQSNQDKGSSDAASWLPAYKPFRCPYVSRQVAVKLRYQLWVTPAERDAMVRVLRGCPGQALPAPGPSG